MKLKIIIILVFITSSIYSQQLLTLEEAIKIALENNFSISIAANQRDIAENNLSAGNAGFLPGLNADGSYSKSNNTTRQEYFDGRLIDRTNAKSDNFNANITLNWTIFDGFEMFATYDALKQLKEIGETNYRISVENNVAGIISTYFNIVRLGVVLEVISRSIVISEERVNLAATKRDVGSASKFELLQAQVDLNEDKSLQLNAELAYDQAKTQLNQLMGRNPAEDFTVADTIIVNQRMLYEELIISAQDQNSEIKAAVLNKNFSNAQLGIVRSEFFPEISLFAGYNFLRSESEAGFTKSNQNRGYNYGINASINLFNGLNTRRQIENAQIETKISELNLNEVKNQIEASLQNSYKAYQNSLTLVELETENLKVTEENVAIALERLRLGNITPLEFREAQINLLDAQSRLVNAQFEAKNAETELLRISGRLIQE
ncbi:MAG: TolC family protein [Ignavibacteriaceae bacterium]